MFIPDHCVESYLNPTLRTLDMIFFSKLTNSENKDFESLIDNQSVSNVYDYVEICYESTLFEMQKCFGQGKSHSITFLN